MDVTMIIILSKKRWQKNLKTIYLLRRKYRKIHNLYSSNKKEVRRIAKNGEEITKNISFILQFIDSRRLIASSLTNLVNNIFE